MRIVTFLAHGLHPEPGLVRGDDVFMLSAAGFADTLSVIRAGSEGRARIEELLGAPPPNSCFRLSSVQLLAPIPRPPKIICIGLNYRDHAAETKSEIPKVPIIFAKYANTIIGPGAPIVLPRNSVKPDYEAEFAFVIGAGGRHIAAADWRRHVYGYMCFNDVSARDFQLASSQWTIGKTFDTFAPTGPWLTTADEIADPHQLDVQLSINGEVMQKSNTSNLIFGVPALIEYLSSVMTLEPGDIVATGTPAGVGLGRHPHRWLKPGEEVVVEITGLGALRNPTVAEA